MTYLEKEEDFEKLISNNLVLVDFYANWCGPCQMLSPVLEELEKMNSEIKIIKIDVDKFQDLARKNGIMSIPALKVYKNSELINQTVGYLEPEELETLIK